MRVPCRSYFVALSLLVLCASAAFAGDAKPVQLSLFSPVQIFPESSSIGLCGSA